MAQNKEIVDRLTKLGGLRQLSPLSFVTGRGVIIQIVSGTEEGGFGLEAADVADFLKSAPADFEALLKG